MRDGPSSEVAEAIGDLRWCNAVVMVYPTWWFNVPGALKGYIDRTFLPHVAFRLPKQSRPDDTGATETGLQPLLTNIEKLGVVSTVRAAGGRRLRTRVRARAKLCHSSPPPHHPIPPHPHTSPPSYRCLPYSYMPIL